MPVCSCANFSYTSTQTSPYRRDRNFTVLPTIVRKRLRVGDLEGYNYFRNQMQLVEIACSLNDFSHFAFLSDLYVVSNYRASLMQDLPTNSDMFIFSFRIVVFVRPEGKI